jgi:hypothetical protein
MTFAFFKVVDGDAKVAKVQNASLAANSSAVERPIGRRVREDHDAKEPPHGVGRRCGVSAA